MNLSDLRQDLLDLAILIYRVNVIFDQFATEPRPASNAMVPLLEAIAQTAQRLANDLDATEREEPYTN